MMDYGTVFENLESVSTEFAQNRSERQLRRELVHRDFEQLEEAGFLLTGVPDEMGGLWESTSRSARPICELLRILARGDSSVALVASMHPAVLSFWLTTADVPTPFQDVWANQRKWIFDTAASGAWWGTITSEPGSGGDVTRTKTVARPDGADDQYTLTGQKHFGSGLGISTYMITTARVEGTEAPDLFFINMKNVPWDGSTGATMTAPWDGHGMIATQSHGMKFDGFPATRCAWPDSIPHLANASNALINCLFSAVTVGIVEIAVETARRRFTRRQGAHLAYEQVEWSRVEMEGWLIQQAYEGMLRAVEGNTNRLHITLQAEMAIAELAESVMRRICRILGGGTFSRHSPFGFWFEDVRALGFLRPPWSLAFDNLFEGSVAQ